MAEGGARDIDRMCSHHNEQVIRVREEPIKGGARACVTGERVNALQMCIWFKTDL